MSLILNPPPDAIRPKLSEWWTQLDTFMKTDCWVSYLRPALEMERQRHFSILRDRRGLSPEETALHIETNGFLDAIETAVEFFHAKKRLEERMNTLSAAASSRS